MANAQTISMGNIVSPETICEGESLRIKPPVVTPSMGWTGQWEIAPATEGPFQTLYSLDNIPLSYNGRYIRYAVFYEGKWLYSNTVNLRVVQDLGVTIVVDGDEEICEGESVTLHAEVDGMVVNYVVPGDILCSDSTIVKPADWPVAGKTPIGIVFYVDNTDLHGWAVSLTQSDNLKWSTENTLINPYINSNFSSYAPNDHWRYAITDMNGYANTLAIRTHPAANYPAGFTPDFDNGWYLPSAGQLNVLFGEIVRVNESLTLVGGTSIYDSIVGTGVYQGSVGKLFLWSSTENRAGTGAYALEMLDGQIGSIGKQGTTVSGAKTVVRAIITFDRE